MNITLRKPWTLEQFLAWEERQELKHEFDGFLPEAMTGGTAAHETIKVNLITALTNRLRGKPCRPYGSDLKVQIENKVRYPDAFVVCSPVAPRNTLVLDPVVIFEVLSPSSGLKDRIVKNQEYQSLPSVRRYVMLEQDSIAATMFERSGDDWVGHILMHDAVLRMPEIGIEFPLAELYEGIDLASDGNPEEWPDAP
ncbi:MAG TPA: Uma2 family endonuclease [Acetobacteraceae bacterium]|nr:Uma2 family endonuclease [Acetobacteraceae bacterium]